jgi:hypothetical protein
MDGDALGCSGERWDGPDSERLGGECQRSDETRWRCGCEGVSGGPLDRTIEVDACLEALRQACEIDLTAPRFCEVAGEATCWPGDDEGSWSCRCGGEGAPSAVQAGSCDEAMTLRCAEQCDSDFGGCRGQLGQPGSYACMCQGESLDLDPAGGEPAPSAPMPAPDSGSEEGTEAPTPPVAPADMPGVGSVGTVVGSQVVAAGSCEQARALACGEQCDSEAGQCALGADGDGFECSCADGGAVSQPLGELGGAGPDACWLGLQRSCGAVLHVPVGMCASEAGGSTAYCEALAWVQRPGQDAPDPRRYSCACGAAAPSEVEADGCYQALQELCPSSIPDDAVPAADGDYGALCQDASDCDTGACYVPGTGQDAICSSRCSTDADCPAGTLCAFVGLGPSDTEGYCFATCESDAHCGLLNGARDNPLYCADRVDIDEAALSGDDESGRVCIQLSEP